LIASTQISIRPLPPAVRCWRPLERSERDEGLAAQKSGRLTLCLAVAIQQLSGLVYVVGLGPVMRENCDHATSSKPHCTNSIRAWNTLCLQVCLCGADNNALARWSACGKKLTATCVPPRPPSKHVTAPNSDLPVGKRALVAGTVNAERMEPDAQIVCIPMHA